MKLLHEKSKCCSAKIIRFGGKRRQCIICRKTWRVHPAKRGRKASRKRKHYLDKVFKHGFSVKQLAVHSCLSTEVIYKKFRKELNAFVAEKRIVRIRGPKLVLIIDAQWQIFKGKYWTLYCLAVKPTNSDKAIIFDPVLKQGRESATIWDTVITEIPFSVKKRVIAVVSDGIRGFDAVAKKHNWIIQRCHFHLLNVLQKMRGKRISTPGRLMREKIYLTAKAILTETSEPRLKILCCRIVKLTHDKQCPVRMRMAVNGMIRHLSEFRNYLEYPSFNLPTTTNVMESVNNLIKRRSGTVNSPQAWHKWAIATIRFKSKFTCK